MSRLVISALAVLAVSGGAVAQSYRTSVIPPVYHIYDQMLRDCTTQRCRSVSRSLAFVRPVLRHIDARFTVKTEQLVRSAIAKGDPRLVRHRLLYLVSLDMRDILVAMKTQTKRDALTPLTRILLNDYFVIVRHHFKRREPTHLRLMKLLHGIRILVLFNSPFGERGEVDLGRLRRHIASLDLAIDSVFAPLARSTGVPDPAVDRLVHTGCRGKRCDCPSS